MSGDYKPDSLTQENKDKAEKTFGVISTVASIALGILSLVKANDKK